MKTVVLQSDNEFDLNLLLSFAQRLGIFFLESKAQIPLEELTEDNIGEVFKETFKPQTPDTSALYEGLNLSKEIKFYKYDEIPKTYNDSNSQYYKPNFSKAQSSFGALEEDEDESLEDLLNMLTP